MAGIINHQWSSTRQEKAKRDGYTVNKEGSYLDGPGLGSSGYRSHSTHCHRPSSSEVWCTLESYTAGQRVHWLGLGWGRGQRELVADRLTLEQSVPSYSYNEGYQHRSGLRSYSVCLCVY